MIKIDNLEFKHNSKKETFNLGPLSLDIEGNLILFGENGSGKTTLLKCLAQLYKINRGTLSNEYKNISFVSSHCSLPWNYLTGIEYILLTNEIKKSKMDKDYLLSLFNNKWKNNLKFLTQKCYTFSSGQIKLAKVVCHLASNSNLVLLDEPDSNLDEHNSELIYSMMSDESLTKGKQIIFSSHKLGLKLDKFKSVILKNGKLC